MITAMPLSELHPFLESEVATVPAASGIYVLFQVENPIHAGEADDLRADLREQRRAFPRATHFSVETGHPDPTQRGERLAQVLAQLQRVRSKTFIGGV